MLVRLKGLSKYYAASILLLCSCREPFEPRIQGNETGFLVVEGYINVGPNAVTTISLARTVGISERPEIVPEPDAFVAIEDRSGNTYPLYHQGDGKYQTATLSLSSENEFRLVILTDDEKKYYSQFERTLVTPPIDSVVWRRNYGGVGIYVSTDDPDNVIKYYQWDYEEVWEIWSAYHSFYEYADGRLTPRPNDEALAMFKCWKYDSPVSLLVQSTADMALSQVPMKRLLQIPVSSEKLSRQYSVSVLQHALTREAFEYLQLMEKNTTTVGSFFDALPSELRGNIYCTTSSEPVVGYVGSYTTSQVRIFIEYYEVPDWNYQRFCDETLVGDTREQFEHYYGQLGLIPTASNGNGTYFGAESFCVDCRLNGGTNNRPPFW